MKTMFRILGTALLVSSLNTVSAAPLAPTTFKDQWDKPLEVTAQTQWVLFSHHKAGNEWIKSAFEQTKLPPLAEHQMVYVADISGMPGLISSLFALPKMRDYSFRIAIANEEEMTQVWPRKDEQVTLLKLENKDVKEVRYLVNEAELLTALQQIQRPASEN